MAARQYHRPDNLHAFSLAIASSLFAPFTAFFALIGWFYVLPPLLFAIGFYLLINYWRAWSPNSTARRHKGFWIISACFNGLLAFATISLLASSLYQGYLSSDLLVWAALALWQFTALVLSLAARRHELQPTTA